MIKNIIKYTLIIIILIIGLNTLFKPTEEDKQAYNTCINSYDAKTCNKLIYGNY